jgi:hypothetical protein
LRRLGSWAFFIGVAVQARCLKSGVSRHAICTYMVILTDIDQCVQVCRRLPALGGAPAEREATGGDKAGYRPIAAPAATDSLGWSRWS